MPLFIDYLDQGSVVISLVLAILFCILFRKMKLVFSYGDPFIIPIFQVVFSFLLVYINDLISNQVLFNFLWFIVVLVFFNYMFSRVEIKRGFSQVDLDGFARFILLVAIIFNIILILKKGFILFSEDVGSAKVEFYRGNGVFKRINQLAIPILSIYCFKLWVFSHGKFSKIHSFLLFLFVSYLLMTMGAKSGIVILVFYYIVFVHFSGVKLDKKFVMLMGGGAVIGTIGMFFIVYGDKALGFLMYRLMSFADGPVYYFASVKSSISGTLAFTYPIEQLAVTFRLMDESSLSSLGPLINRVHFGLVDGLYGPNPQIYVEADAVLGDYSLIYLITFAFLTAFLKNIVRSGYSYVVFSGFFIPILIDSQYAFNNVFNLLILMFFFVLYSFWLLVVKRLVLFDRSGLSI